MIVFTCKQCGREFKGFPSSRRRFCSLSCRTTWANINVPFSRQRKLNISKSLKGNIPWNKGIPRTPEERAKISLHHADVSGKNNPMYGNGHLLKEDKNGNWMGGKSKEPYLKEYNNKLREQIRRRDGYKCVLCGYSQEQSRHKLHTHHIDYDKSNNSSDNLVTLCRWCHIKTNFNRKFWVSHFRKLLSAK